MSGLLSVIVPIYKVEKYLNRCIESIINQSYKNLEIILVDDGSPDKCGEICDDWSTRDKRIKVIHKLNGGLADARNSGIETATGAYLAFVDGDDSIELNMYQRMVNALENNNVGICCCGKRKIYGTKVRIFQHMKNECFFCVDDALKALFVGGVIDESVCDKIFKRELFEKIRFPLGEINEDLPIVPYLFEASGGVYHVGEALYNYHQNEGSITRSGYSEKMNVVIEHIEKIERVWLEKNSAFKRSSGILKCRYSAAMLCRLENSSQRNEYPKEYHWYRKNLEKNCFSYIMNKNIKIQDKITVMSLLTHTNKVLTRVYDWIQKL